MALSIRLAGRVSVEGDGGGFDATDLPGRQGRLVLAYLALNHHPVPRDELAELVWGDGLPRSWERDLSAVVSKLKSLLGRAGADGSLTGALGCYELSLPAGATVDVESARVQLEECERHLRSDRLPDALGAAMTAYELARRPFLPGDEGAWVDDRREDMRRTGGQALDVAIECHRRREELTVALRLARRAIELEPLRERAHVTLIRLLLESGDRSGAVLAYDELRRRLREELGLVPSAEARALAERMLSDEVEGRERFVGREAELRVLMRGLDAAFAGEGQLFLVAGEPGIGKTRLAGVVAGEAQARGARVLWGRCWEGGGSPPYWPWVEVLRECVRTHAPGQGSAYLAHLVPELRSGHAQAPGDLDLESEEGRFALLDAVTGFLRMASMECPLLIVVDDLHAADRPSLLLLDYLARDLRRARMMVVAAYRDVEARLTPEAGELIGELARTGEGVPLGGLSQPDIQRLVGASTAAKASPALAAHVHQVSGGNPFFAVEVVRLLESQGRLGAPPSDGPSALPTAVRETIARRLALLTPETRAALEVAAVIGNDFAADVVSRAADLEMVELREAVDARLVVEQSAPGRYRFAHALVRETLYDGLVHGQRARLHLRAARALEGLAPADPLEQLSLLAHHYLAAASVGGREAAVDYSERAGDRAAAIAAFEEAADHYERALDAAGLGLAAEHRCDLLLKLGDAQWNAGDAAPAHRTFLTAAAVAREAGDPERFAQSALGQAHWMLYRLRAEDPLIALLEEALEGLGDADTPLRARVMARLAVELFHTPQNARRDEMSLEAIRVARATGDPAALFSALWSRNWAASRAATLDERLANAEELLTLAAAGGDREMTFLARHARLMCLLEAADRQAIEREIAGLLQLAEHLHQPLYVWRAVSLRVALALSEGRLTDAERLAGEAYEIARGRYPEIAEIVYHQIHLLAIRFGQGRMEELEENARTVIDRYPWWPRWRQPFFAAELGRRAEAEAELGRHPEDFADLADQFVSGGRVWVLHLCVLAHACALTDDTRRSAALYDLLLPVAGRDAMTLSEIGYGPAAWRLGMLAATLARWEEAECHFHDALESVARGRTEQFAARILIEYARMLATRSGRGDAERARALIARALAICERLELPGVAKRANEVAALVPEPLQT